MYRPAWIQRTLVCLLAWSFSLPPLFPSSVLDFPWLNVDDNTVTGVAVVNSSSSPAVVSLTAYSLDGQVLGAAELTAPAGGQVALLTSELFPRLPAGTQGWIRARSDVEGVTGFFLFLDPGVSQFDGADLPVRSRSLVFSPIRQQTEVSTEITLINPGTRAANVEVSLSAGGVTGAVVVQLAPRGGLRRQVSQLFGLADLPDDGVIRVQSDRDLVGFQIIRSEGRDLLALNARSQADRRNTLLFPQVAVRGGIQSSLGVVNQSDRDARLEITLHRPNGSLYQDELQQNPVSMTLAAGQVLTRDLGEIFGISAGPTLEGWLEVESNAEALNGFLSYQVAPRGATAAVVPVAQGSTRSIFSHIATTRGFFTGVAVLNPGRLAADLRIVALSSSGQRLGVFDTVLPPGTRISRLISDLIPAAAGQDGGIIWIRSNQPVFSSSLFGTQQGSVLANIPPQPALPGFEPDAGMSRVAVAPEFAVVAANGSGQFETVGSENVEWAVQGVAGGSAQTGRISADGTFNAPSEIPALPLVITAQSDSRIGSATVDIVGVDAVHTLSGEVTAAAYLPGARRLVLARTLDGGLGAELVELGPDLETTQVLTLAGETVSALLPLASEGEEILLGTGGTSGQLLRFDIPGRTVTTVASGFEAPQDLALDPLTEGLLVAESKRLTLVARSRFESGARTPEAKKSEPPSSSWIVAGEDLTALAPDRCTGDVYLLTSGGGQLLRLQRDSGKAVAVASGLEGLRALALLYRRGVSCPQASHLLAAESGAGQVVLYRPSAGDLDEWLAEGPRMLTFLPAGNPYTGGAGLALITGQDDQPELSLVDLQGLYRDFPVNPPQRRLPAAESAPGPDLFVSNTTTRPGGLASVSVGYRPAPPGQPAGEGLNTMAFSIGFDPEQLSLDLSDGDLDGIPDSIQSALPGDFTLSVLADPQAGRIDIAIADFTRPFTAIPEGDLLNVVLRVRRSEAASLEVVVLDRPVPSAANNQGQVHRFDQTLAGLVYVQP